MENRIRQFAAAPFTQETPLIDGAINAGEWQQAVSLGSFQQTNGRPGTTATWPTEVKLMHNGRTLFIAATCIEPDTAALKTKASYHDDPLIFFDDRLELFIDALHYHRSYVNLVVNAAGITAEQQVFQWLSGVRTHHPDLQWNTRWQAKTKRYDKRWTAEIAIDFAALGIQLNETPTIGFNIGRVRQPVAQYGDNLRELKVQGAEEFSAWSLTQDGIWETPSNFYESMHFGDLSFASQKFSVKNIGFNQIKYNGEAGKPASFGLNQLLLQIDDPEKLAANLTLSVSTPQSGTVFDTAFTRNKKFTVTQPIRSDSIQTGFYIDVADENLLEMVITDKNNQPLYRTGYLLMAAPLVEYNLEGFYNSSQENDLPIDFSLHTDPQSLQQAKLRLQLINASGTIIFDTSYSTLQPNTSYLFARAKQFTSLHGGNYHINAQLTTASGNYTFSQSFTKPGSTRPDQLSAERKKYDYGGLSGEAVVIDFPGTTARFVFWDKASYIPWWDLDQAVFSNEFVESWDNGVEGCAEPLQDRENRYSKVEIIENTAARVKVKWTYALNDAHYRIHANEWVEEIFSFYPDASGVREVVFWPNTDKDHEVMEAIYVVPPGIHTNQLLQPKRVSLKNLQGVEMDVFAITNNQSAYHSLVSKNAQLIYTTHFKQRAKPFVGIDLSPATLPLAAVNDIDLGIGLLSDHFTRGHWPASVYPVDGYNVIGFARPAHFSLGNIHLLTNRQQQPARYVFLQGLTTDSNQVDLQLAANWFSPVTIVSNLPTNHIVYNKAERAYMVEAGTAKRINFKPTNDLFHPAFVIKSNYEKLKRVAIGRRWLKKKEYSLSVVNGCLLLFLQTTCPAGGEIALTLE